MIAELASRHDALRQALAKHESDIAGLKELSARIDALESNVSAGAQPAGDNGAGVEELAASVAAMELKLGGAREDVAAAINDAVTQINGRIAAWRCASSVWMPASA